MGLELFQNMADRRADIKVPSYDKSAFSGAGDRRPESEWETLNASGKSPVEVIIFEGWCVGFRALPDEVVEEKWRLAKAEYESNGDAYKGQLGKLELEDIIFVNTKLKEYDALTDRFGAFVHMSVRSVQFHLHEYSVD
jgi:D-glycerate 3-kinase